jgi:hypothetical protein
MIIDKKISVEHIDLDKSKTTKYIDSKENLNKFPIWVHLKRNTLKRPKVVFSIYFIPGYKYGFSWRKKNGRAGIRLISKSESQGWYRINSKREPTIKWHRTLLSK